MLSSPRHGSPGILTLTNQPTSTSLKSFLGRTPTRAMKTLPQQSPPHCGRNGRYERAKRIVDWTPLGRPLLKSLAPSQDQNSHPQRPRLPRGVCVNGSRLTALQVFAKVRVASSNLVARSVKKCRSGALSGPCFASSARPKTPSGPHLGHRCLFPGPSWWPNAALLATKSVTADAYVSRRSRRREIAPPSRERGP